MRNLAAQARIRIPLAGSGFMQSGNSLQAQTAARKGTQKMKRRDFLSGSLAAGVGVVLGGSALQGQANDQPNPPSTTTKRRIQDEFQATRFALCLGRIAALPA